jgi:hypothetical protein
MEARRLKCLSAIDNGRTADLLANLTVWPAEASSWTVDEDQAYLAFLGMVIEHALWRLIL